MFKESSFVKLRIVVPVSQANEIRQVLGAAGAGVQGHYDFCSFSFPVTGQFRPNEGAKPALGTIGKIETVAEEVIEVICERTLVASVVAAVRRAHPYEEPAIDIIPRLEIE